ncbi:MAG TPA: hypothetical protein VFC07_15950, partial [Verrucomicrobiae bacterium]|nr:hypothetical protein [Verrucomicrobiae bacterium]
LRPDSPNTPEGWSSWYSLAGSVQPGLAVGKNKDGNLEIFAVNQESGSTLDHKRQSAPIVNGWIGLAWIVQFSNTMRGPGGLMKGFPTSWFKPSPKHLMVIFG